MPEPIANNEALINLDKDLGISPIKLEGKSPMDYIKDLDVGDADYENLTDLVRQAPDNYTPKNPSPKKRPRFSIAIKRRELNKELEKLEKLEQEQVEKQRNATVHKANPVRCYKNVDIRSSDRPVTLPKTPNFSLTRTRHRSS